MFARRTDIFILDCFSKWTANHCFRIDLLLPYSKISLIIWAKVSTIQNLWYFGKTFSYFNYKLIPHQIGCTSTIHHPVVWRLYTLVILCKWTNCCMVTSIDKCTTLSTGKRFIEQKVILIVWKTGGKVCVVEKIIYLE